MVKKIMVVILVLGLVNPVFAQSREKQRRMPLGRVVMQNSKSLELSDAQVGKIDSLMQQARESYWMLCAKLQII